MSLKLIYQDITTVKVDAIVNSTNNMLIGFSGVDSLIHEIGGEEFEKECEKLRYTCVLGKSTHTNAYNLPCKYVIHTMSPEWFGGEDGEEAILRSCYWTALAEAEKLGCKSVAFPLISAGSMEYPIPQALETAITAIREYISLYSDMEVYLVLYGEVVKRIAESTYGDLDQYIESNLKPAGMNDGRSLEELLKTPGDGFVKMLTDFIDAKGLTDAEVYRRAGVTKSTFNKIKNGGTKNPSRPTVIALAMALRLSYDETVKLLASAGHALSDCSKYDIIISYFIKNGKYEIWELDEQLIKYGYGVLVGLE